MSKTARKAATVENRLARLLESPSLVKAVPALPPETLRLLIRHRGLDSCAELVAAATPEQLTRVLDIDLWRPALAGLDDGLDVDRFGEWLEALDETGDGVAARIIGSLDAHLVVAGLSAYIKVVDSATLVPWTEDGEQTDIDSLPSSDLTLELAGYVVTPRRADAWDAIASLLAELDARDPDCFHAIMTGCRRLSSSAPEIDGLDDLLTTPEQLVHDVGAIRSERRSQQGYAAPADARAFLRMARQPRTGPPEGPGSRNPVAAAYFRTTGADTNSAREHTQRKDDDPRTPADADREWIDAVVALLAEADLPTTRPQALLEGVVSPPVPYAVVRRLLEGVRDADEGIFAIRERELAFLANTLISGCSLQSKQFAPPEASEAVLAICNLGLEHWPARTGSALANPGSREDSDAMPPGTLLLGHDLVTAFEVGWGMLHQEVSMFVAEHLIAILRDFQYLDLQTRQDLQALRRELERQCRTGTPWEARDALDVIATLDQLAWVSLLGLLGECPVIPAALVAIVEGSTRRVSATAFELISTSSQIRQVQAFILKLPGLLR